jgi:hypothetical protein
MDQSWTVIQYMKVDPDACSAVIQSYKKTLSDAKCISARIQFVPFVIAMESQEVLSGSRIRLTVLKRYLTLINHRTIQ